ncbi:MAG: FixH family protein [Cyanobacteriota bacterium]
MILLKKINAIFVFTLLFSLLTNFSNFSLAEDFKVQQTLKKSIGKNIFVIFETDAKKFSKMNPINAKIKIVDKNKKPLEKALVTLDLTMPSMSMPENKVKLKETEKGIYSGEIIFTMGGDWRINTDILLPNNKKEKVFFDISVN